MKFLIADDHAIVRKGLGQLLLEEFPNAEIVEVASGAEAIESCRNRIWDIILMDISMPGINGIEALKQMRANGVKAPILMLSTHSETQYAIRVLKAGASGYVNKASATEELAKAIHKVLSGVKYVNEETLSLIGREDVVLLDHESLTDREMQVLQMLGSGKSVSEIAADIFLSVNTVSTYRTRVLSKLQLTNNSELIRYSLDNNLL